MKQVIVIGAGFGGLATAIRTQAAGAHVTLLELQDRPGGRAAGFHSDGYYFDAGPTIVTELPLIRDLWATSSRKLEDYIQTAPLDPFYRVYFSDGTSFDYCGDTERMVAQIAAISPRDVDGYHRFISAVKAIYEGAFQGLAREPFLKFGDMLRAAPALLASGAWMPVYYYVSRFLRDERLRQLFSFQAMFIGGNPYRASAIYAVIPYIERQGGVHYVQGGTNSLARAMARLFTELGGEIVYGADVEEILVDNGRASGTILKDGRVFRADAVVSNADVSTTYGRMIRPEHRRKYTDRRLDRMRYSMSCFLLYLGTNRQYPNFEHHNVILRGSYRETIRDIFQRRRLPSNPSYYLYIPSRSDATMAPEGCESMYVLAPVPHQVPEIDWKQEAGPFRQRVLADLEGMGMTGLRESIVVEQMRTPDDFAGSLQAVRGNAFAFEPTLFQSAYFRPHNRSEDVARLYFAGAGTHPGAGIPGVLLSAEVTSRLVREDLGLRQVVNPPKAVLV